MFSKISFITDSNIGPTLELSKTLDPTSIVGTDIQSYFAELFKVPIPEKILKMCQLGQISVVNHFEIAQCSLLWQH